PSRHHISTAIDRLVDLFRKIAATPRKTIAGLWAELFVIARAQDPETLLSFWHVEPDDRFDFSQGKDRIEVKAAQGRHRSHHFSLEQLRPGGGVRVVISSLLVERLQGGAIHDAPIPPFVPAARGLVHFSVVGAQLQPYELVLRQLREHHAAD